MVYIMNLIPKYCPLFALLSIGNGKTGESPAVRSHAAQFQMNYFKASFMAYLPSSQ